jgi:hypothetical protein
MTFSHPPPYVAQSSRQIVVRTQATGAQTNVAFTYAQLSGILGIVATGALTSNFWTTVFRLTNLRMWGPVATAGTPVSVSVTWTESSNDFESPPITKADSSISFDYPAFLDCKPPRGSLISKWHGSAQTDEALALTFPAGCIVDFQFDFVLSDYGAPVIGPTIAGGTNGNLYHKSVNSLTAVVVNSI